jgi:uncharacterized membrane protein
MAISLKNVNTYWVETEDAAEELVSEIKSDSSYTVVGYTITKKVKKEFEYYIVKVVLEYNEEKDIVAGMVG